MSKIPYGIRSVKIENFRGIDKLELDFTDPQGNPSDIIVIGGPNGCGKTAVLEACLLALGHESVLQGSKGNAAVRVGTDGTRIDIEFVHVVNDKPTASSIRYSQSVVSRPTWFANGLPVERPLVPACSYTPSWRTPKLIGALPISLGKADMFSEENVLPFVKQRLINLRMFNLINNSGTAKLADADEELKILNAVWKRFYPYQESSFSIGSPSPTPDAGFDVFFSTKGTKLSVDRLSAGQLEVFCLFANLIPIRNLNAVILIDEPELHLDPQWHATLLHELRRFLPQSQFIVATHSPGIAESVNSYQRFYLVPEDDPRMIAWGLKKQEPELAHV